MKDYPWNVLEKKPNFEFSWFERNLRFSVYAGVIVVLILVIVFFASFSYINPYNLIDHKEFNGAIVSPVEENGMWTINDTVHVYGNFLVQGAYNETNYILVGNILYNFTNSGVATINGTSMIFIPNSITLNCTVYSQEGAITSFEIVSNAISYFENSILIAMLGLAFVGLCPLYMIDKNLVESAIQKLSDEKNKIRYEGIKSIPINEDYKLLVDRTDLVRSHLLEICRASREKLQNVASFCLANVTILLGIAYFVNSQEIQAGLLAIFDIFVSLSIFILLYTIYEIYNYENERSEDMISCWNEETYSKFKSSIDEELSNALLVHEQIGRWTLESLYFHNITEIITLSNENENLKKLRQSYFRRLIAPMAYTFIGILFLMLPIYASSIVLLMTGFTFSAGFMISMENLMDSAKTDLSVTRYALFFSESAINKTLPANNNFQLDWYKFRKLGVLPIITSNFQNDEKKKMIDEVSRIAGLSGVDLTKKQPFGSVKGTFDLAGFCVPVLLVQTYGLSESSDIYPKITEDGNIITIDKFIQSEFRKR